jgi:glucokinase
LGSGSSSGSSSGLGSSWEGRARVRGMEHVLAVDVGGTKLAAGVVDDRGVLVASARTATAGGDGEELFARLLALVHGVLDDAAVPVAGCGVGCGGPMAPGGETVSPLNIPQWRDFALRARLASALQCPVTVDNDAKALALGEGWRGAAQGERNYVGMVVSTGVGGGCVVDGRLLDGASGNAGHIGHVVVVPDGRHCACGGRGCLEAHASGTAIAAITGREARLAPDAVRVETGRLVGLALAGVVHLLDVRLAVVAGSVALGFGAPFFAAAQRALDDNAQLAYARGARVVPGGLGADGPLVGAAAVGWRGLGVALDASPAPVGREP